MVEGRATNTGRAEQNQKYVRDLIEKHGWTERIHTAALLEIEIAMDRLSLTAAERSSIL
jgi:hypothetical protein